MLISSLRSGGAERVATTLANYWAEAGWEITIITLADRGTDFYTVRPGVRRIALNLEGESHGNVSGLLNNLSRIRAVRQELLRLRPDIALGFMNSTNIICGLASVGSGIISVGSEHNHPPNARMGRKWGVLSRCIYPRMAAISALTEKGAEWIRDNTGARKVPVMPNPISFPLPDGEPIANPEVTKSRLGGEHHLLAVGRLVESKGFDRLLDAFAKLRERNSSWRLTILGEGRLRNSLVRQLDNLSLADVVAMPGAVGNVGDWYRASDAYVMTSIFEGFGNTLAEALSHGLPAVAVDCESGPREILRHEVDGFLVPPDDPDALVLALDRMMGDEELRNRFAARAIEARQRFNVARIAKQWELLFEELRDGCRP